MSSQVNHTNSNDKNCAENTKNGGMNLPNKLTVLRIIIVPVFVFFMLADFVPLNYLWALILFAAASLTDLLDGKIARSRNLVTSFGKFLDPLADKILVISALICMIELGWTYSWLVAIIVAREFVVSGIRLIAVQSDDKTVIAASIWGKLKTASTMASICIIFALHILLQLEVFNNSVPIQLISDILMYISTALTVISGVQYLISYRHLIDSNK